MPVWSGVGETESAKGVGSKVTEKRWKDRMKGYHREGSETVWVKLKVGIH